jgi:hypothetical protein
LNLNSSENHKIKTKRLPDIQVIDFTRKKPEPKNSLGRLTEIDIITIGTA